MPRIKLDKPAKSWLKRFYLDQYGALRFRIEIMTRYHDLKRLHGLAEGISIGEVVIVHYNHGKTRDLYLRTLRQYQFLDVSLYTKNKYILFYLKDDVIGLDHVRLINQQKLQYLQE